MGKSNSHTHTIPSLSGTFGTRTWLALNPKMPKEPSSPSRSNSQTEKHCSEIETNRLGNNNGQRTTHGIVHAGFRGLRRFVARKKSRCKLMKIAS